MRHQTKRHRLGRTHAHRRATLAALSTALIEHKRITTTVSRAKALRVYVEPLINRAKDDTTHNRREVFRHLQNKQAVTELFGDVATRIGDRPGGYTRVVKLGRRAGDAAEMAVIELVDYNDVQPGGGAGSGRRRRTRRGTSGGGGRRRSGQKEATTQSEARATTKTVETAQQSTPHAHGETVTTEQPVSEEQATPVVERTEPQAEAKAVAEEVAEERADQDAVAEEATAEASDAVAEAEAPAEAEDAAKENDTTAQADTPAGDDDSESAADQDPEKQA